LEGLVVSTLLTTRICVSDRIALSSCFIRSLQYLIQSLTAVWRTFFLQGDQILRRVESVFEVFFFVHGRLYVGPLDGLLQSTGLGPFHVQIVQQFFLKKFNRNTDCIVLSRVSVKNVLTTDVRLGVVRKLTFSSASLAFSARNVNSRCWAATNCPANSCLVATAVRSLSSLSANSSSNAVSSDLNFRWSCKNVKITIS